jgi:two-component system, NarL family, sensor histidine kinase UhpB
MGPLRILLVEDSPEDALLVRAVLERSGVIAECKRVDTIPALRKALQTEHWDIILADYQLPTLTGIDALEMSQAMGIDAPFIIVSGMIGEERAAAAMKAGADDYVLKENLARLAPAVERAFREADIRRHEKRAQAELARREAQLNEAQALAHIGSWDWEIAVNRVSWSDELYRIFKLDPQQFNGTYEGFLQFVHPDDRAETGRRVARALEEHKAYSVEHRIVRPDNCIRVLHTRGRIVRDAAGRPMRMHGTSQDVTELKEAERAAREAGVRLKALSRRLLALQETERRNVARELHDEFGQALTAVKMNLSAIKRSSNPDTREKRVDDSIQLVERLVQSVRTLSLNLRPPLLDDFGLQSALKWYVGEQAKRSGIDIRFVAPSSVPRTEPAVETTCFRVAQEAITNVLRHAKATTATVELRLEPDALVLLVRDNGIGLDPTAVQAQAHAGHSLGWAGMQERVSLVGGQFECQSAPGKGTELRVRLPLPAPQK